MHERHSSLDRIAARSTTRRLCRLSERRPADGAENTHPITDTCIEATVRLGPGSNVNNDESGSFPMCLDLDLVTSEMEHRGVDTAVLSFSSRGQRR
jgi:hypothetical protein